MHTYYQGHAATVRQLVPQDLFALYRQPAVAAVLHAYRPAYSEQAMDPQAAADRLEWLSRMQPPPEMEALVLHRLSDTPLGFMSLSSLDQVNAKAELSVAFFRGRGSRPVLEAIHWVLEAAFESLQLRKLIFYVLPENDAARRLLEALSITCEAVLCAEIRLSANECSDLLRYCLFRDEWASSPARRRLQALVPLATSP